MKSVASLDAEGVALRAEVLRRVRDSGLGAHIGPAFSVMEIVRAVYQGARGLRPGAAEAGRDHVVLSKGHGCLALYAVLARLGFIAAAEIGTVGALGARLGGHPERDLAVGLEATTGALGHGLPLAVGMALGARMQGRGRVFVICGDGELNEGAVWEAALHAAKHHLSNLLVLVDSNGQQCNGRTEDVLPMGDLLEKWRAFGFRAEALDGHDISRLVAAIEAPSSTGQPTALICHTIKNRGVPGREADPAWHYRAQISKAEVDEILAALWPMAVG